MRKQAKSHSYLAQQRAIDKSLLLVISDLKGNIQHVSSKFLEITGYTLDEVIGKNPRELIRSGLHKKTFFEKMWKTILSGGVWEGEIKNRKKDGSYYWVISTITAIRDDKENICGFLAIQQDITARKMLETVKNDFITSISHEIRNPMSIVQLCIDNLLESISGSLNKRQIAILLKAKSNNHRLSTILKNLIEFSDFKSSSIKIEMAPTNMKELLHALTNKFKPFFIERHLDFDINIKDDIPTCKVDKLYFGHVLNNLLKNALMFSTYRTKFCVESKEGNLIISVNNDGKYLSKVKLQKIFDPFTQHHRKNKGGYQGVGLGLAISKHIIGHHGGKLWAESSKKDGTTLLLSIPTIKASAKKAA